MGVTTDQKDTFLFPGAYLRNFSTQVFMHSGVSKADAEQAADVLARSDLRGIDSHGVARLHTYFVMLELGRINAKPKIKIIREKASVAAVDGDNGLGLVVGPKANEIAMDKAEKYGSGWVSVCNTNHFGIAGYYPLKALERDLIGWAMTNSTKLVAPLCGSEREMGGHKGYGLASMVDILCCVLSGANWGPFAPPFALRQEIPARSVGKGIGHFFGALQIDGFIDKDEFKKQIDEWIQVFRNTKPAPGTHGPLIPGDPEREAEAIRNKEGVPLLKPVVDDLLDISRKTGIAFEAK